MFGAILFLGGGQKNLQKATSFLKKGIYFVTNIFLSQKIKKS
jgi:hypothetical protein